jgi:hypothetical protein
MPSCFVVALIYLERFFETQLDLQLSIGNSQRLLLVSVMVAEKFLEDLSLTNAAWYFFI